MLGLDGPWLEPLDGQRTELDQPVGVAQPFDQVVRWKDHVERRVGPQLLLETLVGRHDDELQVVVEQQRDLAKRVG